ncbi:hydrogenase maturation protease [Prauserella shujinwangii]|uniref:Hydrogenase maturation protease n=1 Tax=Prauserella shujinwangii TaxID=1453103 RepID=A0A2T0M2R0_9PSEU|nr:hydrogenase maturation protease [Prauserella shujinwangii]PRX51002.1 hydrogenase maturation protease [Prauserella shujinwangii]
MTPRVLVAGIGNIFLGDDGFGSEVALRMSRMDVPERVRVADYGIRGMHLAYEMLDGRFASTVLVDTVSRGGAPGTLYEIEADPDSCADADVDAHAMTPAAVLALLRRLGGVPGRVLVLGCEPERVDEGIGLSPAVAAVVDPAARRALQLAAAEAARAPAAATREE